MISVIVCTHNRCRYLDAMLASFYAQDLAGLSFELLVVDNCSTDGTREVADAFAGRPGFRYLYEAQQGLSHARNRGVAESRGEVTAFLDDDVVVSEEWLRCLERCFAETGADVVGGRSLLRFEQPAPPWLGGELRKMLSEVELGPLRRDAGHGGRLYGLNLAYRKAALEAVGGFHTGYGRGGGKNLSGEDLRANAAIAAAGGMLVYEPSALVYHCIPPERCEWEYLLRMAAAAADTRLALDTDIPWRVLVTRCFEASAKYCAALLSLPLGGLYGRNSYAWRRPRIVMARTGRLTLGYLRTLLR